MYIFSFLVDTKDAGVGELEVICEAMGEKRVRLPIDIREDGHTHKVRLRPTVPAHYRIYINYGGKLYAWVFQFTLITLSW